MDDPIPGFLLRLRRYLAPWAYILPFNKIDVHYKGGYYPVVIPDYNFNTTFSPVVDRWGQFSDMRRSTVIANLLTELKDKWFVVCMASEERNEFVQYDCHLNPFVLFRDSLVILYLIHLIHRLKLKALYPKCYVLDFPCPRTPKGRKNLRIALEIAKENGLVPTEKFDAEFRRTNRYPKSYWVTPSPNKKFNYVKLSCGPDRSLAGRLGDEILQRVYGNTSPVRANFGQFD